MAFLFIWQFLLSGPLELGSALVAIAQFSTALSPGFQEWNEQWTRRWVLWEEQRLAVTVGPARLLGLLAGLALVALLYRRIPSLGKLTVVLWLGVLATIAWILIEGALHFRAERAFDFSGAAASWPSNLATRLGPAMILAVYSYLGYYNVCYLG